MNDSRVNAVCHRLRTFGDGVVRLYRLGDFYEAFDADAHVMHLVCGASKMMLGRDLPIYLAGIPYWRVTEAVRKLKADGREVELHGEVPEAEASGGGDDAGNQAI